jgi:hypothetical protein
MMRPDARERHLKALRRHPAIKRPAQRVTDDFTVPVQEFTPMSSVIRGW